MGFVAGEQIRARQLVGIGADGLCYPMFVEEAARAMAKAVQVPWELISPERKNSEAPAIPMDWISIKGGKQ